MDLRWRSLIIMTGMILLLVISFCVTGSQALGRTPARTLAVRTGAAHFEERFEKIQPDKLSHRMRKRASDEDLDYEVYQGVVGRPGIDFPILPRIPQTTFSCRTFGNGYFADLETECQVFHICEEGRKISFLCPNGTIFQQSELTCDWWFKVNCAGSPGLYAESSEMLSRAQNRAKQRSQTAKNEFHSSERDYSHERGSSNGNKNQYPVKSGRRPSQNAHNNRKPFTRRIDSDEIPSVENLDFEDLSTSRESLEKPSEKLTTKNSNVPLQSRFKDSESQEVAESASFFDNKNGNQRRNGYTYDNPNNNDKNRNGYKSRTNNRGRNKFEGQSRNKGTTSTATSTSNETADNKSQTAKEQSQNNLIETPPLIHYPANEVETQNLLESTSRVNPGTYTTARKLETTRTTPYYTPTVPSLGNKVTQSISSENQITTEKYAVISTTKKSSAKLGYSLDFVTVPPNSAQTTISSNKLKSTSYTPLVIGMRGNIASDSKLTETTGKDHSGEDIHFISSSYSPLTTPRTNRRPSALTTTAIPIITTSTSGPTYLPKDSTTNRPSSSGPTYLPKESTTIHPSSSGPTYLPTQRPQSSQSQDSVTTHVKEMIKTLNDLNVDTKDLDKDVNKYLGKPARPGLEIPPSSGPETLASLASYFATADEISQSASAALSPSLTSLTTERIPNKVKTNPRIESGLLTGKTVGNYDELFGLNLPKLPATAATPLADVLLPTFGSRYQEENDLEGQHSNGPLGDSIGKPETRKIAKVFTNALSAYLEDPVQFKNVLSAVRPTEPPSSEEIFATGAPATWRRPSTNKNRGSTLVPSLSTTVIPPTTTAVEDLEVLDFSDVTIKNNKKVSSQQSRTTVPPSTVTISSNDNDVFSSSRFATDPPKSRFSTDPPKSNDVATTTESNDIASEINKGLHASTPKPLSLVVDLLAPEFSSDSVTTELPDSATSLPILSFDLLPPDGSDKKPTLSADILPPSIDEDDDMLQRAQSQSFVASRNNLGTSGKSDRKGKATKLPGHFITGKFTPSPVATTIAPEFKATPNPWTHLAQTVYLDPLTINDGLMNEFKTTTSSPFTYLPKSRTTTIPTGTTEQIPTHVDLSSMLQSINTNDADILDSSIVSTRTGKTLLDDKSTVNDDLLPPKDGMKKIAVKMFGGLNETQADHLMNVMKKAESNQIVRRLILLLIQTCDEDYGKTVEESRQALLNALIGMDSKFEFDDEVEVIKLKPRRQKSIGSARRSENLIDTTTIKIPVTTYRRSIDLLSKSPTQSPSIIQTTTDYPRYTTTTTLSSRPEDTTRFEIRVEDPEEYLVNTSTTDSEQNLQTTTTTTIQPETTTFSLNSRSTNSDYQQTQTQTIINSRTNSDTRTTTYQSYPIDFNTDSTIITTTTTTEPPITGSRRKAKDLGAYVSESQQLINNSHKNSDERALELLKSLYSLASKFGKR